MHGEKLKKLYRYWGSFGQIGINFLLFIGILPDLSSNFSVQRQDNLAFSAVACDQTIEQTANRDSKTKGGLVGFSMNRASVHRWLLSQSERAAISRKCKDMAGMNYKPRYDHSRKIVIWNARTFFYNYKECTSYNRVYKLMCCT